MRVEPERKGSKFCFVIIRTRDVKFNVYYVVYILYINIYYLIVKKSNKIEVINMYFSVLIWIKINTNLGKGIVFGMYVV